MVAINVAYTQATNPAGATPVISRAQLWAGMEMKVRKAHEFVPVFSDCKVLEEHDNVIVQETTLKTNRGTTGKDSEGDLETVQASKGKSSQSVSWQLALAQNRLIL
jgi:hypothetical protein